MSTDQKELEAWRDCGRRLFPYVRYFGLCGAELAAVEAVSTLARLLGHRPEEHLVSPEQVELSIQEVRTKTIMEVASHIRESSDIKAAYGNGGTNSLADYVEKLTQEG